MLLHKMKEHILYEIRNLTLYVQEKKSAFREKYGPLPYRQAGFTVQIICSHRRHLFMC